MKKIAYLGPEGTFSGILARKRFGNKAAYVACPTLEGVFEQVLSGTTPLGIVPVENSSGGTVYDTVDLLIRHGGHIFIREELSLDIRIALLGHAGHAVQTIFSHFTQIKHHGAWLRKRYPKVRLMPVESTALAAQRAASRNRAAALAAPSAAAMYDLDVLEFPSGSEAVNVTHFLTIASTPATNSASDRTALAAVLRNECGSLYHFLAPFAREHVSLTRIVSRPIPGQPQTYVFYVEIERGPADLCVKRALARAKKISQSLTSLGTFSTGRRFRS